ncbi:hypothetical protein IW261DRAFT_1139485 [Armillaria novae-zelandiae]|uniref:Uncharacterized protein n=1 Tax=Armillaria novae-zelandiae TaxID=153914 RepID=A0AA39TCX6_9AGAR|nr:hypothetical protein IW261DRAFT_1139485 [Armillaria novae-zelandiae]
MRFSLLFTLSALPVIASACEGDCITGVTADFVTGVLGFLKSEVLPGFVRELYTLMDVPSPSDDSQLLSPFKPLLDAFENDAPPCFQENIFPGYFHGKCQVNGVDPPGCPNPDCEVVCGTPGSMVHHYQKLIEIVLNSTMTVCQNMTTPHSNVYQAVEKNMLETISSHSSSRRMFRFSRSTFYPTISTTPSATGFSKRSSISIFSRVFKAYMRRFPQTVRNACGTGKDRCTFPYMKKKILSYP